MKKSLLSLVTLALAFSTIGVVDATLNMSELFSDGEPISKDSYARLLNDYETDGGYLNSTALTCDANNEITITSSVVEDSIFEESPYYRLFISPYRVEQLKNGDPSVDFSKIIMKDGEVNNMSDVKFTITASDIDPNASYYGFIVPLDIYDMVLTPSKEICFQLNGNMCLLGDECDTFSGIMGSLTNPDKPSNTDSTTHGTSDGTFNDLDSANGGTVGGNDHGVSCAGMDLAHVTHSVSGDKLTLKWTAVDGDKVEIAIWDPDEKMYKRVANVDMKDEKYVYTMQRNGEQNFRLVSPCGDYNYKADAAIGEPTKDPEIKVTPATGPAENVLYIAVAAIVLYGAYTVFFRKSDN